MPRCGRGIVLLEQAPQKTFPQLRQWCLRFVKVKGVLQRMQTSESIHSGGCHRSVCAAPWSRDGMTYGATVQHAAGYVLLWGKVEALALQHMVNFIDIGQAAPALCGCCPGLYQLEHLALDVVIGCDCRGRAEQRGHIIEELSGGDFLDKVGAAILDARVGELGRC